MASTQLDRIKDFLPSGKQAEYSWETLAATVYQVDEHSYAVGVAETEAKYKLLHIQIRQLIACHRVDMVAGDHEGCVGAVEHALYQLDGAP